MLIVLSSSSDSVDKAIDEYSDHSSFSGSSDSDSSSGGNTTDEYISGVPGVPLEVLQEGLKTRFEFGSKAITSASSSTVQDEEEEVVYSCAIGVDSKTDDRKIPGSRTREKLWTQETSRRRSTTRMDAEGNFRNEEGNAGIQLFIGNGP